MTPGLVNARVQQAQPAHRRKRRTGASGDHATPQAAVALGFVRAVTRAEHRTDPHDLDLLGGKLGAIDMTGSPG
jgi:hypothetical protein